MSQRSSHDLGTLRACNEPRSQQGVKEVPREPAMSQGVSKVMEAAMSQRASNEPGSQQGAWEPARSPESQQ